MHWLSFNFTDRPGVLFVLSGAIVFYLAGRLAADALTIGGRSPTSLRIAIAHFLPIGFVALVASLTGNAHVAVGVVFATAVAAMSLNLGVSASSAEHAEPPLPSARAWAFLLPASVMALMAGFGAELSPTHAIMLLAQGMFAVFVWTTRHEVPGSGPEFPNPKVPLPRARLVQLATAVALAGFGGWIGVNVAAHISNETGIMSHGLIAAVVLAPLLMLPMIGTSSTLAQRGYVRASIEASVMLALLNLCLLLPACIAAWHARPLLDPYLARIVDPTIGEYASTQPVSAVTQIIPIEPMYYPLVVWRLDTVVLIVLSLLMLPVALGRWTIGRKEGFGLIVCYAVYLLLMTKTGARW